jgi:hypothetical protein
MQPHADQRNVFAIGRGVIDKIPRAAIEDEDGPAADDFALGVVNNQRRIFVDSQAEPIRVLRQG